MLYFLYLYRKRFPSDLGTRVIEAHRKSRPAEKIRIEAIFQPMFDNAGEEEDIDDVIAAAMKGRKRQSPPSDEDEVDDEMEDFLDGKDTYPSAMPNIDAISVCLRFLIILFVFAIDRFFLMRIYATCTTTPLSTCTRRALYAKRSSTQRQNGLEHQTSCSTLRHCRTW